MSTTTNVAILYHEYCSDGVGAACAAYLYYQEQNLSCSFYGLNPNKLLDGLEPVMMLDPNTQVKAFDVSFDQVAYQLLSERFSDLVIADHHQSTLNRLGDGKDPTTLPEKIIFDQNRSGCVLAWDYFFHDRQAPLFLQYLQDRDLYLFTLPDSREVTTGLNELCPVKYLDDRKLDLSLWVQYAKDINGDSWLNQTKALGKILLDHQRKTIEKLSASACLVNFEGTQVALCNSPVEISDLGNYLAREFECDYSMIYRLSGSKVYISLRSLRESGSDVAEVAQRYGGGGHCQASGFTTTLDKFKIFKTEEDDTLILNIEV